MEMCYIHIFIYAEFKIIDMFFLKERRSKYKPAYALKTQNVLNCSCLYRDVSLVMDIWFKVLEKSFKTHRSTCQTPVRCVLCLCETTCDPAPRKRML